MGFIFFFFYHTEQHIEFHNRRSKWHSLQSKGRLLTTESPGKSPCERLKSNLSLIFLVFPILQTLILWPPHICSGTLSAIAIPEYLPLAYRSKDLSDTCNIRSYLGLVGLNFRSFEMWFEHKSSDLWARNLLKFWNEYVVSLVQYYLSVVRMNSRSKDQPHHFCWFYFPFSIKTKNLIHHNKGFKRCLMEYYSVI